MRRMRLAAHLMLLVATAGCYESAFPLGPPSEGRIDPGLVGRWRCINGEDGQDDPSMVSLVPFDETQYYVGLEQEGETPEHYRAHSSNLKGVSLFNVQELETTASTAKRKWWFLRLNLLKENILQVQVVNDKALEGIEPSAKAVRAAVEKKLDEPNFYVDFLVCAKHVERSE